MSESGEQSKNRNWPKDTFARDEVFAQMWLVWAGITLAVTVVFVSPLLNIFSRSHGVVIAYCAQDQVYAESIFHDFEKQTGIKVRAVYDSEAVKTVGLANRLMAERSHPRCDVFWGNEEMRTRQMADQYVFRETSGWDALGY